MPQHKASTAVTIASATDKSPFALFVEKYWMVGAGIILAVVVWILYSEHADTALKEVGDQSWSKLLAVTSEDPTSGMLTGSADDLRRVGDDLRGTPAGPWALYLAATSAVGNREFDKAEQALAELRKSYPDHQLVKLPLEGDPQSRATVADALEKRIQAGRAFAREHEALFGNPELPADAPRVRLNTDRGTIVVGLYANLAPKHTENFLKLVRAGSYAGTKFHSVVNGEYIRGGDPTSVSGDPETWGKGGPGYALDFEATGLHHFAGVISAVPDPGDATKTSGSQFLITSAEAFSLDETYMPFGKVLEGLDVVRAIEALPLAEKSFTRPKDPATLTTAEAP